MADDKTVTYEKFSELLSWLHPDKESAAARYEIIRRRLIRVFASRGCTEAEAMADLTIDRVTIKAPELSNSYEGDPALYFYGVTKKVLQEWYRKDKRARSSFSSDPDTGSADHREAEYGCLEKCLEALSLNVREMIVDYYRDDKRARIERRREIADRLGITVGALQIRTSRVRARLADCVRDCLADAA